MHNGLKHDASSIRKVTYLAMLFNVLLFIVKVIVGVLNGSISLIADGVHSISDTSTDLAVLIGASFGAKKADRSHPYGHGRIETVSAALISVVLMGVGMMMVYYAARGILKTDEIEPSMNVGIVAVISILVKEFLYQITRKVARQTHSSAVYANAWHHRSDALSSIAVLIGFAAVKFGYPYGDHIAAIIVGVMVIMIGIHIFADCFREFTEVSVDTETIERIRSILDADASIRHWHKLRSRMVGREVFLDLHILVEPSLDVASAHEISEKLEQTIHNELPRPVNIIVHIEPDIPELRKE